MRWLWRTIALVVSIVVIVFLLIWAFSLFEVVEPWHRWVKVSLGTVAPIPLDEWLHWKKPFIDEIVQVDVRIKKKQVSAGSSSKDLQLVTTALALNYHLLSSKVTEIFQEIGDERAVEETIIAPAIQEIVKAVTAKYTAEELITKRDEVSIGIKEWLITKLEKANVTVTDVNIEDFMFSDGFNKAIESKVTAEQEALRSKNDLERIKFEAEQAKAKAEWEANAILQKARAEAEGIKEINASLSKEYVQYEMVKSWKGEVPTISGGDNGFLLDINSILQ